MVGRQGFLSIGDLSRGWLLLYGSELVFDKLYVCDQILKHVWPKNRFLFVKHRRSLVELVYEMLNASWLKHFDE